METAIRKPVRAELILCIIASLAAIALLVMVALCLPYFGAEEEDPEVIARGPHESTGAFTTEADPPPEASTEPEETLPPPEANPYGRNDFQYDGDYLTCLKGKSVLGIDVSAYQGNVDWPAVREAGVRFAMIRVGYRGYGKSGKLVYDEYLEQNLKGAAEAGLDIGVYFFSQAVNTEEAEEEARYVLDAIRDCGIDLHVVYDWEYVSDTARTANVDARTLTDCSLAFCKVIEEAGYTPMVYFNSYQAKNMMHLAELKQYDFWLALYTDRMTFPYKVKMWQYTNQGRVPGIQGDVDINLFFSY